MYQLHASVLHWRCCGYILVRVSRTLVHLLWYVGRACADALVAWHIGEEVAEAFLLQRRSGLREALCAVVRRVEADGQRCACRGGCEGYHACCLVAVALEEAQSHATLQRKVAEGVLLAEALVPVACMGKLCLPRLAVALLVVGLGAWLVGYVCEE